MVNNVASDLRDRAKAFVDERAVEIELSLSRSGLAVQCVTDWDCSENKNDHYYKSQMVKTAKYLNHWINFNEPGLFVDMSINPENELRIPRLVFVVSLHHIGSRFTGIMAATAFAQAIYNAENMYLQNDEQLVRNVNTCSPEAFTFTGDVKIERVSDSFNDWIQEALTEALAFWGRYYVSRPRPYNSFVP